MILYKFFFFLRWLQVNFWVSANNFANFYPTSIHLYFLIACEWAVHCWSMTDEIPRGGKAMANVVTRTRFCTRLTVPPLARAKSQISPNGLVADARHECSTRTQMRTLAWQLFKREKEQQTRLSNIVSVRQQFVREFGLVKRIRWRMQIASYREYFHWIASLPVSNLVGFIHIFLLEFVLVISWPFLANFLAFFKMFLLRYSQYDLFEISLAVRPSSTRVF